MEFGGGWALSFPGGIAVKCFGVKSAGLEWTTSVGFV